MNKILRACPKCRKQVYFEIRVGKRNCKLICPECELKIFFKCTKPIPETLDLYFPRKSNKYLYDS